MKRMAEMGSTFLHVQRLGSKGFPLLLLHGWGRSSEALMPLASLLSVNSQVHVVDLPGFGQSEIPPDVWDGFQYATRLIEYLDEQGIEKIDLAGHSFGGKIGLCLAIHYPKRVRQMALLASAGLRRNHSLPQKMRYLSIKGLRSLYKGIDKVFGTSFFLEQFVPRFASEDYKKSGAMRLILVKSVNEDLSSKLGQVLCPTLILWGDEDTETPPEIAKRLHEGIKGSQLYIFPNKNHYLFDDTGAHLCAHYMLPFFNGHLR